MNAMPDANARTPSARLPSFDLFKGFEASARLLSFTKAAAELHLTQSAVSRQVQDLESQLGVVLFVRRPRALVLTEAGQLLYPVAAQLIASVRAVTDRVRSLASGRRVLAVATPPSFASFWLIPRLAGFAKRCPGVDVRIATQQRGAEAVHDGIALTIRYCEPERAGTKAVRLFGERAFPVCAPALLSDPKRPLRTPQDLRHHVLLRMEEAPWRYPWLSWRTWLEAVGAEGLRPTRTLTFANYEQVIAAARAGQGVALGRSPLLERELAARSLVAPFAADVASARAFYVETAAEAAAREEVVTFVRWLRSEASRDERAAKAKAD
jgi:LysR family transcriptional regulator, glycine cleavage system transcriptional activator